MLDFCGDDAILVLFKNICRHYAKIYPDIIEYEEGKRFVSRYYRNRRLGEFLKELDLSEGHSSGIPTIQDELERNGSPRAEFFTDDDRRAMRIRIPIHPVFLEKADKDSSAENATNEKNETSFETSLKQVLKQSDYDKLYVVIQKLASEKNITIQEVMTLTGKSRTTAWRYMKKLTDTKLVESSGNTNDAVYTVVGA